MSDITSPMAVGQTIVGGAGDDVFEGTEGNDNLQGQGGNDWLSGGAGVDELIGGSGNDTLTGGSARDSLYGGSGNDVYVFNADSQFDLVYDSYGNDTVLIEALPHNVTLSRLEGSLDLVVRLGESSLFIKNYFSPTDEGRIEHIAFMDGTSWAPADVAMILANAPPPPPPAGTAGDDILKGDANDNSLEGLGGNDILKGFDGDDILDGGEGNDVLEGGEGDDVLNAGAGNDVLQGGAGTDLLEGAEGDDTYIWSPESGIDVVRDYGGHDRLKINATPDQLKFFGNFGDKGYPLIIQLSEEQQIAIEGYFNEETYKNGHIEEIVFSDGSVWTMEDVLKVLIPVENPPAGKVINGNAGDEALQGTSGNDTINGMGGDDTINGGAGNDVLIGGEGNDTYVWGPQSGQDRIVDSQGINTIRIDGYPSEVSLSGDQNGGALNIAVNGQVLSIRNYFNTTNPHEEKIVFSDGTIWTKASVEEILSHQNPEPAGKVIHGKEINETLEGGAGNDVIYGNGGNDVLYGDRGDDSLSGGDGDDEMMGSAGNDTFIGGAGHDTMLGGNGDDTYIFTADSEFDTVYDFYGNDTVRIAGLPQDVTLARIEGTLNLSIRLGDSTLVINSYFNTTDQGPIEQIVFEDGSIWTLADVEEILSHQTPPPPPVGTPGDDILKGDATDNVLEGFGGDDKLYGLDGNDVLDGGEGSDLLEGGMGNDAYVWKPEGDDVIYDVGGSDEVRIGDYDGFLTWSRQIGTKDLCLAVDGGSLTIKDFYDDANGIERFIFSNGDVLTRADILERLPRPANEGKHLIGQDIDETLVGTDYNDTIEGMGGDDILRGEAGDDLLSGGGGDDQLEGGYGNDTYIWGPEDGNDLIFDLQGNDIVKIDAAFSSVSLSRDPNDLTTLILTLNGHELRLNYYFITGGEGDQEGLIESIVFNDKTLTLADVEEILSHNPPPPSGQIIIRGDGDDILEGGAGDDTLVGGGGNDTYDWKAGSGSDRIRDASGNDKVRLDAPASEFIFSKDSSGNLVIFRFGHTLTIEDYFAGGLVEQIVFSNGEVWTRTEVLKALGQEPGPSDGDDLVVGKDVDETLEGGGGNDTIDGAGGNDLLLGGTGSDTYRWSASRGHDVIKDAAGDADRVVIDASWKEATFSRTGTSKSDLVIDLHGEKLTIQDYFNLSTSGGYIESLTFSDATLEIDQVWEALKKGSAGNDFIKGGKNRDDLVGNAGQDSLDGGDGNDVLRGGEDDDQLQGGTGNDTVDGGSGADKLYGGSGKDYLTGGSSRDVFIFSKVDLGSRDVITDFRRGQDKIDLRDIDANSLKKGDNAFTKLLSSGQKFTAAGQLRYDAKTGILSGNTDKDAAAEFQIQLKNKPGALHLGDFYL